MTWHKENCDAVMRSSKQTTHTHTCALARTHTNGSLTKNILRAKWSLPLDSQQMPSFTYSVCWLQFAMGFSSLSFTGFCFTTLNKGLIYHRSDGWQTHVRMRAHALDKTHQWCISKIEQNGTNKTKSGIICTHNYDLGYDSMNCTTQLM